MDCSNFDAVLDSYLDRRLSKSELTACEKHLVDCCSCHEIVAAQQETRALLTTAVTETVTAVDVSGIWRNVEKALDGEFTQRPETMPWSLPFGIGDRLRGLMGTRVSRPMVWGGALAAAAVALFVIGSQTEPQRTLPAPMELSGQLTAAPSSIKIHALEAAAGHTVATWSQPRSNSRVIWVAASDDFGVTRARY